MRAARLVLSDHGVGLFAAEGAQAIVAVRRVSARTACSMLAVRDRSWEHSCGWEWPWRLAYPSTRRAALPPIRSFLAGRAIKICDLTDAASDPKVDVMS